MADKSMESSPKNGSAAPNEGASIKPSAHSKMTLLRQQMEENRKKLQRREQEISHSKRNLEQLMGSFEGMERSLSISSVASESDFSFSEPNATAKIVKDVMSADDSKSLANDKDCQILKSKLSRVEEEKKKIRDDFEKRYRTLDELNRTNEEKCSKLKAENAFLSEKVRLFALSTDKLEEENRKLKEELNDKEDEKELGQIEVETRYNHLLKEHQQLQDRFHYLHEELNGKHQLISDWKTRYQSLDETYQEMSNRYQALSEQSKLESNEQSENDQLWKSRYHLLESELESVIEKNTESEKSWKSQLNELNTVIQSLESDKDKQAKELCNLQQLLDQERGRCESLQSEITSYQSETGRFTQLLVEHEALSKEFQFLKDAYEKQSEDYGALTQKYQSNGLPSLTSPVTNDASTSKAKNQRGKKKAKKFSEIVQQSAENEPQIPITEVVSNTEELTTLKSQLEDALRSKESLEAEIQALTTKWRLEFQALSESLLCNVDKLQHSEELLRSVNARLNTIEAQKSAPSAEIQHTVPVELNESWKTEKADLEANVARLEQELTEKESEISRLKLELTEWGTSEENVVSPDTDKFEKDLANLEAQLALKEGELEDANQELAMLRTELEEVRAQTGDEVGNVQGEIFKLRAKMKDLEYWLTERTNSVQTLEEKLQAKDKLVQELKMQIEVDARTLRNAEEQLADDEANRQVVEERLEAKEAEVQRLQQALQKLQHSLQSLESQLTEKSAEVSRLSDDLQEAEQVLNEKDAKIKALFEENRELKIERDNNAESFNNFAEIANRCQQLETQLQDKEDQLQKLQSYNNLSVAHVQEAEDSRQVFENQYQVLEQDMKQTRSVLAEKEDALEKLTEKYKKVAAVLKQKLVIIQNLEAKLKSQPVPAAGSAGNSATKDGSVSQEKYAELESTYNQISSELQQRRAEVSALRDELRAKEEMFTSSEQDLRTFYEEQLEKMQETLQNAEKAFETRLGELSTEVGTLQHSLAESQSLVEDLRQEAESNRALAEHLQRQCDEAKALEATTFETSALQNKLVSLEASYHQVLADLDHSKLESEKLREGIVAKDQILAVSEQDLRHVYEEQLAQLHQRLAETEEAWKGRLSEAEQEIVTLQHDLEKSTSLVQHLTQECETNRLRAEQAHAQYEELQLHVSTLASQLSSVQENLAITQNYLKDAEKEIEVLDAELVQCKTSLEARNNELVQAQQYIDSLASTPNYAVELQQAQEYNQQLVSQLRDLEEQLKFAQENEHRLGERQQSLSEIHEATRNQNALLSEELQTLREKLGVAEEEREKLRQELVESQQGEEHARNEVQQSKATHEALQQELSLLRIQTEQVAVLEQELFEVRGALADALQKNEEAQARVLQLQEMATASEAEKELEAVKLQWEESRRGHEYYYQECQNLFAQLEYARGDVARLQAELETSEAGRAAVVQELEEIRVKAADFATQLSNVSVDQQQRQEELDRVNESFSQYRVNMTSQLSHCQSAVQFLRKAYAELKSQSELCLKQGQEELQGDLAVVWGKWRDLEADCHQSRAVLQLERQSNAEMAAQMEALQRSSDYNLAQWQTVAAELERVKVQENNSPELTQSVEELNAQLLESQKSVEYYTQEWHNQNAQLWHLDGLLRTAQQACEEAKLQNATQLQELSDLKTQLESLTQERQHFHDEWQNAVVASQEQINRVSELQKEISVLQKYQQDFESQTETLIDTQKLLDELRQSSLQYEAQREQRELEVETLRAQLASAQESRHTAEVNVEKLRGEIRALQGQLERLQVDVSELESSVASKAQQVEYYQSEWQNSLGQVDGLKSELSLLRSREDSSLTAHQALEDLRRQQQELQQKCSILEDDARLAGIANQDLTRANEDLKRVNEDLNRSVESQAVKVTELLAAITESEEKSRNSEQTVASLNSDNIHLRGMLTQAEEDKSNLQSQMDQMQTQIIALQNQAGHVETSTENLSNQVRNVQAALQEKEAQFTALTQDFERLQRDRRNLQQVCNLLEEEKEELEAKLAALELDKETWEADVLQLKDRNEALQAEMMAVREASVQRKESVPLQQAMPDNRLVEELEGRLNASRQESERMAAELQTTKVKSAKLLRQVKQLQAEREKFQASVKAVDDPLQQLAQEEMQSQIDQAHQSSQALKDKLTALQTERDRLVAQLDVLHAAQENYLEYKERLEAENAQLFQSNRALSATVSSLEWKISELEENLQSLKSTPTKEKSDTAKPEEESSGEGEVVEEPVVASKAWETTDDATQEKDEKEVLRLREEIASLLEEKTQLAQENEEFQDVLDEFKLEVDRLKAENDFYIDIVRQLSMTGTLSPSTIAKLKEELQNSNVDLDASLSEEDYANEPNYWQKTLNDLQMEVEFLRSRNSMMMNRLKEAGIEVEEDFNEEGNAEALELMQLKTALDTAMKNLHERDVRCQELGWEISKLVEERDTLQIRLSDALRQLYGKVVPVTSEVEWQEDLDRKLRAIKDASVQIDRNMQAYGKNAREMGDKLQRPSPGTTALLAHWLRGKSLHRVQHV